MGNKVKGVVAKGTGRRKQLSKKNRTKQPKEIKKKSLAAKPVLQLRTKKKRVGPTATEKAIAIDEVEVGDDDIEFVRDNAAYSNFFESMDAKAFE